MLHSLSALLVLPLLAFSPIQTDGPPDNVALMAALEAVRAANLSADLHFLASDDMRGRETPSPELRIAADFLRARVQRLGFQPGAENGWYHEYPLHSSHLDASAASLSMVSSLGEDSLTFAESYYLERSSHAFDSDLEAEVICVGRGKSKDIEKVDVTGKWALILHNGKVLSSVVKRALKAGALGVIATPGEDYSRDTYYPERYRKSSLKLLEGGRPSPTLRERKSGPPQIMLDREGAKRLFALSEVEFEGDYPPLGTELGVTLHETRHLVPETTPAQNVCAFWPGSDPELSKEVMIVSAHYDHVGVGREQQVFNGADDNASGTTGLLGLADALRAYGPLRRSVLLLWVSGEEKGLWGSEAWTEDPWLPEGCTPVLDLNIDMIGRTEKEELYITPSREHDAFNGVADAAYRLSHLEGFPELESQDEYWRRSDHMNFDVNLHIPVAFISTGSHPDYHKPTDTPDKIDYEKMTRIVRFVVRLLDELQDEELESWDLSEQASEPEAELSAPDLPEK